jgi:hypothetical protein
MDFDVAILNLNKILEEKQPSNFSPSWIYTNNPKSYRYFRKNIITENGSIDWDKITSSLDRSFQNKWVRYRYKQSKPYEKQSEVDLVLTKYKDKLYMFICILKKEDRIFQDRMIVSLVRLGQKGNIIAQQEVVKWVSYIVDDWIDKYRQIHKWKGYRDEVDDKIRSCIRCYRYTGSFLGYLFRTLEYSARGKPPICSLDDKMFDGDKTRIDFVVCENQYTFDTMNK